MSLKELIYELYIFILGLFFGLFIAAFLFIFILSKNNTNAHNSQVQTGKILHKRHDEDVTLFNEALTYLKSLAIEKDTPAINLVEKNSFSSTDIAHLEKYFLEDSKELQDRSKQIKNMASYFSDVSKIFLSTSRDLTKMSNGATSNIIRSENENLMDKVWRAIAIAIENLALDTQSLSESITNDIVPSFQKMYEEQSIISKRLHNDGNSLISSFKESVLLLEIRTKERDKSRDKLHSSISTSNESKAILKLEASEKSLVEASGVVKTKAVNISHMLPRILTDFRMTATNSTSQLQQHLLKFSNSVKNSYGNNATQISKTFHESVSDCCAGHRDWLQGLLLARTGGGEWVPAAADRTVGAALATLGQSEAGLDMRAEAVSVLAASSPLASRPPAALAPAVGRETCVWFNAFAGRIYRDIGESDYFQGWACRKMAYLLNKGKRPDYVSEFVVQEISFGSVPPLLSDVQWSPLSGVGAEQPTDYDVSCTAHLSFRSGVRIKISTSIWCTKFASIPVTFLLEIEEIIGRVRFGVDRGSSFVAFLEEPHSRLKAHTAVGGDQFKLNNVPQLSDYLVKKVREKIRTRLVSPNAHRMRLIWPRNWWPPGTETNFMARSSNAPPPPPPLVADLATAEPLKAADESRSGRAAAAGGPRSRSMSGAVAQWFKAKPATASEQQLAEAGQSDAPADASPQLRPGRPSDQKDDAEVASAPASASAGLHDQRTRRSPGTLSPQRSRTPARPRPRRRGRSLPAVAAAANGEHKRTRRCRSQPASRDLAAPIPDFRPDPKAMAKPGDKPPTAPATVGQSTWLSKLRQTAQAFKSAPEPAPEEERRGRLSSRDATTSLFRSFQTNPRASVTTPPPDTRRYLFGKFLNK